MSFLSQINAHYRITASDFEETIRRNKEKQERLKKERQKRNLSVLNKDYEDEDYEDEDEDEKIPYGLFEDCTLWDEFKKGYFYAAVPKDKKRVEMILKSIKTEKQFNAAFLGEDDASEEMQSFSSEQETQAFIKKLAGKGFFDDHSPDDSEYEETYGIMPFDLTTIENNLSLMNKKTRKIS